MKPDFERQLDYLDGMVLAQTLVLKELLQSLPNAAENLRQELENAISQLEQIPIGLEKRRALINTLDNLLDDSDSRHVLSLREDAGRERAAIG